MAEVKSEKNDPKAGVEADRRPERPERPEQGPGGPTVPVVVQGQLLTAPSPGRGRKRGSAPVGLLDGPDLGSAAPQRERDRDGKEVKEGEPVAATIMTSCGELDREAAIMGRVGGVGTVSIQEMT